MELSKHDILSLAYNGALSVWAFEDNFKKQNPPDAINDLREMQAWERLQAVRALLLECEQEQEAQA